jgi:hypothetical protein
MAKEKAGNDGAAEKLKFKREKSHILTIVDQRKKEVGSVCVRPDSVGWKPAGETQWHRLTLKDFQNLAMQHGTKGDI